MNFYIHINSTNKAKQDIDILMKGLGFKDIAIRGFGGRSMETFIRKSLTVLSDLFRLRKDDILIIQYPYKKYYVILCRIAHLKGAKTITLIHDLGSFRRRKLTSQQEIRRLSHTDYIIAHNECMKSWLLDNGCKVPIGNLDIFDYLSDRDPDEYSTQAPHCRIAYAGRIAKRKNMFWHKASEAIKGCTLDLFGPCDLNSDKFGENISFKGFIPSDDFISSVKADWGLVWDGDSTEGLTGTWGEYLKINNPHKTSFYLRAGLPVIVCRESAMAHFIEENKIGITVNSLSDLPARLNRISHEEYQAIKNNAMVIKERLQDGYYFKRAVNEAISKISI